jgi:hypothetical protein
MTDTIFADVSYYQAAADNSYPYRVLSIRSNDGNFRDPKFYQNYRWCVDAVESGRLEFFIVYFYWRTSSGDVDTHVDMVTRAGGPHPKMVTMIDLESGGNPGGDWSGELNNEFNRLAGWLGNPLRVIAYANRSDYQNMWRNHPASLRWVGAGYPTNPNLPNQIAHQYTNGVINAGGLPLGAPPFGNCDMNSANGLSPEEFAAACGVGAEDEDEMAGWTPELVFRAMVLLENQAGVRRPSTARFRHLGEGDVNTCAGFAWTADGNVYDNLIIKLAEYGDPDALNVLREIASADPQKYPDRQGDRATAQRILTKLSK